jgi:tetratricopeptide (TPR) repeat protein
VNAARIAPLLPIAVALGLFAPTVGFELTNWDDTAYVTASHLIRDLSWEGFVRILDPRSHVVYDWTPLVTLSYAVEYHWVGDVAPALHHATNVGLHALTAGAVVGLLLRMGFPLAVAVTGALLFAVHPLQVESVAWVSGRKTILATLFGVLCARVYMGGSTRARAGALALFAAALLSKATLVALPLFLLATDRMRGRLRAAAPWLLLFFGLAVARTAISVWAQVDVVDDAQERGITGRLAVLGPVLITYARQVFLPVDLNAHYTWPVLGWADPRVLLGWGIVITAALLVARAGLRSRPVAHAAWWIVAAMLPVLNVLPAPHLQADRYLYTALAGVGALGVLPLVRFGQAGGGRRVLGGAVIALAILALGAMTVSRSQVWVSSVPLWTDTLERDPDFAVAHGNLGSALLIAGRVEDSERSLRRALELEPRLVEARLALVSILRLRGARDEAARELDRVLAAEPDNAGALVLAGEMAEFRADTVRARDSYAEALRHNPSAIRALERLAVLEAEEGNRESALERIATARRYRPNRRGLDVTEAWVYARVGEPNEAETRLVALAANDPAWAEPVYVLGLVHLEREDREGALRAFDEALARDPGHGRARVQRAELRIEAGDRKGAEADLRAALSVTPGRPRVVLPLVNLLVEDGRAEDALRVLTRALSVRESPDLLQRMAKLLATQNPDRARAYARRALALLPDDARPAWREDVERIAQ